MSIEDCSELYRTIRGVGPIARFDDLSSDAVCKQLYKDGSNYTKDALVAGFCNRFDKANLPSRCKCYRFKDTDDYRQYNSLWKELASDKVDGVSGDPMLGSFACFYEECSANPQSYKTSEVLRAQDHCPTTVYCKQTVGSVDIKDAKSLSDVAVKLEQKCGVGNSDTNEGGDAGGNGGESVGNETSSKMYVVYVMALVAFILVAMLVVKRIMA
jgi:hypothetical protein